MHEEVDIMPAIMKQCYKILKIAKHKLINFIQIYLIIEKFASHLLPPNKYRNKKLHMQNLSLCYKTSILNHIQQHW